MKKTPWFERKFPPVEDSGLMPSILERLEGTPARLRDKIGKINADTSASEAGKWSIKKEIGHLIDLEPLWYGRMQQIMAGERDLEKADLTNRKTHETDYDSSSAEQLIAEFTRHREAMMALLRHIEATDLEKAAVHPRLGTPMRLTDLAFFVAEHDDHHLAQITALSQG